MIFHRDNCARPTPHVYRGRMGDWLEHCDDCGRWAVLDSSEAGLPTSTPAPARPARLEMPAFNTDLPRSGASWPRHKARARGRRSRKARAARLARLERRANQRGNAA